MKKQVTILYKKIFTKDYNKHMQQSQPTILDVGQCNLDHGNIAHMLQSSLQAKVDRAHHVLEAISCIHDHDYNLVLVNRIFDADGHEGLDFISQVKAESFGKQVNVMLVSNYEDAQNKAVALGAIRGFGKDAIANATTIDMLRHCAT